MEPNRIGEGEYGAQQGNWNPISRRLIMMKLRKKLMAEQFIWQVTLPDHHFWR
jgi:hypothetical protein